MEESNIIIKKIVLCECGEFINNDTFKDYIKTSSNPSTATIGHSKCGIIFNFVDQKGPKKYSSKKELKIIAMKFTISIDLDERSSCNFLLEVDRLKSIGNLSDNEILNLAYKNIASK